MKAHDLEWRLVEELTKKYPHEIKDDPNGVIYMWTNNTGLSSNLIHNLALVCSAVHQYDETMFFFTLLDKSDKVIGSNTRRFSLCFKHEKPYNDWLLWLSKLPEDYYLFPILCNGSDAIYPVETHLSEKTGTGQQVTKADLTIHQWLYENVSSHYSRYGKFFFFTDREDAVRFKLSISKDDEGKR